MAPQPIKVPEPIRFGKDFELDTTARRLSRGSHALKLERIPLEILILLLEHWGEIVTRDEIVAKVWGQGVFLDTDNSIRGAIRKIRQVLKDDPEQPQFIQTVTGQGYRFVAPVIGPEEENRASVSTFEKEGEKARRRETPVHVEGGYGRTTPVRRRWLVLGVAAGVALLVLAYVMFRRPSASVMGPKITSLAVLPLKNLSGDPAQEYFADGMTEAIIGRLSMIRGLRVISRTSVMRFKDSRASVPEIAKTLGVDAIVEGSVIREGGRVRVQAQLIRAATDEHFWSEAYDRELQDVLSLQSDVAQSIARKVEVTVTGEEHARLTAARSVSPDVYESYLRGQFTLAKSSNRAGVDESVRYFEEVIKRDPTFASAYVGLATAHADLGSILIGAAPPEEERPKAISAARRALELDPDLADAYIVLAEIHRIQWHWAESEAEYRRALDLNPSNAKAHIGLALWLLCQGRIEDALDWSRRGRKLDPIAVSGGAVGWILFNAHRYDEAIQEFRSALVTGPDDVGMLWFLGFALVHSNHPKEAIPVMEKGMAISNRSPAIVGVLVGAYAHAGRRAEALRLVDELRRRRQTSYVPAASFVNAYSGLGDTEQTFTWLEQAYKEKSNLVQWLKVDPLFDPLRNDPRFKDLLHRVGLDQP